MASAYCWATGAIGVGDIVPEGAIPLAFGDAKELQDAITGLATLAYDNKTYLIPGFGMVEPGNARLDLVADFADRVRACFR